MKVLFVCLGNICRSPTAESIFRKRATGLKGQWLFDSAGTSGNHVGEKSDPRSIRHAAGREYEMTHLARQFSANDFKHFDLILVMDSNNQRDVLGLANGAEAQKVRLITDYCKVNDQGARPEKVPDPYYGGPQGFEEVIDLLEEAAEGFFRSIKA